MSFFPKLTTKLTPLSKNCSISAKSLYHVYLKNDTLAQSIIAQNDILNENNNFPTNEILYWKLTHMQVNIS